MDSSGKFSYSFRRYPLLRWIIGIFVIAKYLFENNELTFLDSIFAHFYPVEIIEINLNLNIIISNSKDNLILIRKLYDFELLTIIKIPKGYEIKLIKLSPLNFIYILCDYLNKEKQTKSTIFGYTVSL